MKRLAITAFVLLSLVVFTIPARAAEYHSDLPAKTTRTWLAPEFWANRLHDWRLHVGRIECTEGRANHPFRTVHLLTHQLAGADKKIELSMETGLIDVNRQVSRQAATGFLIGVGRGKLDHRAAALVHANPGPGAGIFVGMNAWGAHAILDREKPNESVPTTAGPGPIRRATLRLIIEPVGDDQAKVTIIFEPGGDAKTTRNERVFPRDRIAGNIALVSHPGTAGNNQTTGRFWFRDLKVAGDNVTENKSQTVGPVISAQHTLHHAGGDDGHVLKLTAQLMPVAETDPQRASLQIKDGDDFKTIATEKIIVPGWTATFRIPRWNATRDTPYRVVYDDQPAFTGTIRRDPVDKPSIAVAGFTGNHNCWYGIGNDKRFDWMTNLWFPHADITQHVAQHKPDVLFFSGDQVYEGASPTYPDRQNIKLDYMYKWYLWCWAYRDLARDTPCITIPDDHDVYQGNIWGQGGRKSPGRDHHGGYVHPADFVKLVERTQCANLPDPFDPTPVEQGIGVYYTDMVYGRVSLAIIEDRKFKSGCARDDMPPSGTGRPDHFNDPDFDVSKLDIKGVQLLGDRQLKFLRHWAGDWRGHDMKIACSQTHFANMATHHGGGLSHLIADLDSNGWPQTGRRKAIEELRRGFAFHLAGDQHLATIIHHGLDEHGDSIFAMTVPSIANFYPRAWSPKNPGEYKYPDPADFTGEHLDGFRNKVTVFAATNPGRDMGHQPAALHDRMPGYGIVRLNKTDRTYTLECWPRYADPTKDKQYRGWPMTIHQKQNYGRQAVAHLPTIEVTGLKNPVVQVIDREGVLVYALRVKGETFKPKVFAEGEYTVKVGEPDKGKWESKKVRSGVGGTLKFGF